jgi:hypothetical protein
VCLLGRGHQARRQQREPHGVRTQSSKPHRSSIADATDRREGLR